MITFKFYKAFGNSKSTWLDKLIAISSFGKYSHVEIIDDDGYSVNISPRVNGVKIVKDKHYNEDRWDTLVVHDRYGIDVTNLIRTRFFNRKYDYIGALLSVVNYRSIFCSNYRLFCSEAGAAYMGYENPCVYNPNNLYRRIKNDIK